MKTRILSIAIAAIAALVLLSCETEEKNYDFESPHFIVQYYDVSFVRAVEPVNHYYIDLQPLQDGWYQYKNKDGFTEGGEKEVFDSLAAKNNDLAYNRTIHCTLALPTNWSHAYAYDLSDYTASSADITNIEIVSNKAWDDNHPAGTSMKDLFIFKGANKYLYIKSGYSDAVSDHMKIEKPLSEMTADDYRMTLYTIQENAKFVRLEPAGRPSQDPLPHKLTITVSMDNGEEYVSEVTLNNVL